jgi:hypothetical protein
VTKKAKKPAAKKTAAKAYVLRTCKADVTAHGGFKWPTEGKVAAADWKPSKECGNGLHGLLGGVGNGGLLDWSPDAKWLVVEVDASSVVDLGGQVKFPGGVVVFCGERLEAIAKLLALGCPNIGIVSGTATAGDRGTATAGDSGTATAGDRGTATAGYRGTATAGDRGTATAGYRGTATAGDRGTATAGDRGCISIEWYDDANGYRRKIGLIGENGLKPNTPYRVERGEFVEVKK